MSHVLIFLSAVTSEFGDYRNQLRNELRLLNATVRTQEDLKGTGEATLGKLSSYIAACKAVIHLAGRTSGYPAPHLDDVKVKHPDFAERVPSIAQFLEPGAETLSYTQWEAYLALYHRVKLFIARPTYVKPDEIEPAQKAHLARLQTIDRWPEFEFANADQLIARILSSSVLELLRQATAPLSEFTANRLLDLLDRQDAVDSIVEENGGEFRVVCGREEDAINDLRQRLKDVELPWLSRRESKPEFDLMSRGAWRKHLLRGGAASGWTPRHLGWPFSEDELVEFTVNEAHDWFIRRLLSDFPQPRTVPATLASLYEHLRLVRERYVIYADVPDRSRRARESAELIARLAETFRRAPGDYLRIVIYIQRQSGALLTRPGWSLICHALSAYPSVKRVMLREVRRDQLLEWAELAENVVLMPANRVMDDVAGVYDEASRISLPFGIALGSRRLQTLPMTRLREKLCKRVRGWPANRSDD
jgi:hypothetical protein